MYTIAHIENDFSEKFAVPRQSGIADKIVSKIVFEPEFRNADALRGLEDFSHIWLIWEFSEATRRNKSVENEDNSQMSCGDSIAENVPETAKSCEWRPTVRPPRLGGNTRIGVFATRSPFRPNPIGLSCVKIEKIVYKSENGPIIYVLGADLMNGTPIYDIKPYIPYADCKSDAKGGFTDEVAKREVQVVFPEELKSVIPRKSLPGLLEILAQDPRPAYQNDSERVYTFTYTEKEVSFKCDGAVLTVLKVR